MGKSKLTPEQRESIREAWPAQTQIVLAKLYGVSKTAIWKVVNWRQRQKVTKRSPSPT